jgi:energy-coupling factor transport system ATP-binding protein
LSAAELTESVVLGDVCVALCVVGRFLPGGGLLRLVAVVPFAAVASRHRMRTAVTSAAAAGSVGFLVAGAGVVSSIFACAVLGAVVGVAFRHQWSGWRTALVAAATVWPPIAVGIVGVLLVFDDLRRLTFAQIRNTWLGASRILNDLGFDRVASAGNDAVAFLVRWWWLFIPLALLVAIVAATLTAQLIASPVLRRLEDALPRSHVGFDGEARDAGSPGPVPVRLAEVGYSFPGSISPALVDVSMSVDSGEFVAVVGENGSGKSTLIGLLAGKAPTSGAISRPGPPGLGRQGGTGLVFQRPEAQVLGVRVRDDVVWGLPNGHDVDVHRVLGLVGLASFADRETATLSGGELQRLAVAGVLAREPRLLLSDESTAMVDHTGRKQLIRLFRQLTRENGLAVVHVTHDPLESAGATRTIALQEGSLIPSLPKNSDGAQSRERGGDDQGQRVSTIPLVQLEGVGHVYAEGSPWAHRALHALDLAVRPGEGLLVVGSNGSGKSTLAWILAGLVTPSEGTALLEGRPLHQCVGHVALSLQHARLQLQRPIVRDDIAAASGADTDVVSEVLHLVGLDPSFGDRHIDHLSGGEQRRVAIAGLLARRPRMLVLDEPFAGLDADGRETLSRVLQDLRTTAALALVIVSHDQEPALRIADRVVTLGGGRVVSDHPPYHRNPRGETPSDHVH